MKWKDTADAETIETEEMEFDEERYATLGGGGQRIDGFPWGKMAMGAAVVIAIFLVLSSFGSDPSDPGDQIQFLEKRLEALEKKVVLSELPTAVSPSVETDAGAQKMLAQRMDQLEAALDQRFDKINVEMKRVRELAQRATREKKAAPKPKPTPDKPKPQVKSTAAATYRVLKGDTLYAIGRKYNMRVDTLRRINGLGKDDSIQPGQMLKVKP